MRVRPRAILAAVLGTLISVLLFVTSYGFHSLFGPQFVGFYVCALIMGVHTATKVDFVLIGIPLNAALYAIVIFTLLTLSGSRSSKVPKPS